MLTSVLIFLSVLPFCLSLDPGPPLTLSNEPLTVLNIGNDTNPVHFYQISNANDFPNFGLVSAWPTPQHQPTWFRPIPPGATIQILVSIILQIFAPLPPDQPIGMNYLALGPEYRPNMNHLDTRIAVREYRVSEWGAGAIGEQILRNGDIVAAAHILGNLYRRGEARTEDAWRMCYVDDWQALNRCSGVIMVQRDLWLWGSG
ncbi:MAG: hypothetical protein L6R38_005104 [Xanthoria sp. 2 TBL-2021]|nr:MAG: hypothetical protein L6R38_005104 [Xanthoria sp. 2 TBL-2021]